MNSILILSAMWEIEMAKSWESLFRKCENSEMKEDIS